MTLDTDPKADTLMRIGIDLVNFDFPDGPKSVAPTLAKVGSAAEA